MQNAITSCSLNFLSDIVTELSRISTSSCESRIWALIWGLIYIGKDRWQMTIAQNLEITTVKQLIARRNELSSVRAISPFSFSNSPKWNLCPRRGCFIPDYGDHSFKMRITWAQCYQHHPHIQSSTPLYHGEYLSSERQNCGRQNRRTQPSWEEKAF